jgi:hypothetical protein
MYTDLWKCVNSMAEATVNERSRDPEVGENRNLQALIHGSVQPPLPVAWAVLFSGGFHRAGDGVRRLSQLLGEGVQGLPRVRLLAGKTPAALAVYRAKGL